MLELEEARERILRTISSLPAVTIPLNTAAGRILAEKVSAAIDLPPFDNSAMDGYAVIADDLKTASPELPARLRVVGRVSAGEVCAEAVQSGTCVRLFTGSALPPGANAVVMQEDTRVSLHQPDEVLCHEPVKPWENIRFRGEDVKEGQGMLESGQRLTSGMLALLAATGLGELKVRCQPVIGLLATGNELLEPGQPLVPGKIFESNRTSLCPLVARAGAVPRLYPLVPDVLPATMRALEMAFAECDAVITSGGVSVGEFDLVREAFERLGGTLEFWRIAIKPGKPFTFGRWQNKLLFGLPGNPASAMVTFLLLARPALLRLQGATCVELPSHPGVLEEPLVNRGDRRHFMSVVVDEQGNVRPAGAQASNIISSLATANALVDVPPGTTMSAGARVKAIRTDG